MGPEGAEPTEVVPATERVIVGLCHALNDRIAAVAAYLYLLERRDAAPDLMRVLHAQLERLGHAVRLVRSLARDAVPAPAPVALGLLAETATELMEAYPDGPVRYVPRPGAEGAVVRCDWTRALRAMVVGGAWVSRETQQPVTVEVESKADDEATSVLLSARGELPRAAAEELPKDLGLAGVRLLRLGERALAIRFAR